MTEKKSVLPVVPVLNKSEYEVSNATWTALHDEIVRLTTLINAGTELEPADVNEVKALAKQVRNYGVSYRRAITTSATNYKNLLDQELNRLGYDVIERYIETKRTEQQMATSQRLSAKIMHFNGLVQTELSRTTVLKNSSIANNVGNDLLTRFPKVNSGAASKEINNWEPIKSVIRMSIMRADQVMAQYPILQQMPAAAKAMRSISEYLATGDVHKTENINDDLKADLPLLQRIALKPRVATDESTVQEIQNILNTEDIDAKVKLERVQLVLQVYNLTSH